MDLETKQILTGLADVVDGILMVMEWSADVPLREEKRKLRALRERLDGIEESHD